MLEKLEDVGLWITLLIVGALFLGFGAFDIKAAAAGNEWPKMPSRSWWEIATIMGGTLIVVQGFETSRYLGERYDEATRINSCRLSQIVSTVVYLVFIALATPLMHYLGGNVVINCAEAIRDSLVALINTKVLQSTLLGRRASKPRRGVPSKIRLPAHLLAYEVISSRQQSGSPKLPSQNQSPDFS